MDPRKDAHSTLLSKKETSNLYKIQCEWLRSRPTCLPGGLRGSCWGLGAQALWGYPHPSFPQTPPPRHFTSRSLSFVSVHNVKPECLDAYNSLT